MVLRVEKEEFLTPSIIFVIFFLQILKSFDIIYK
jgi:hypothetical protein